MSETQARGSRCGALTERLGLLGDRAIFADRRSSVAVHELGRQMHITMPRDEVAFRFLRSITPRGAERDHRRRPAERSFAATGWSRLRGCDAIEIGEGRRAKRARAREADRSSVQCHGGLCDSGIRDRPERDQLAPDLPAWSRDSCRSIEDGGAARAPYGWIAPTSPKRQRVNSAWSMHSLALRARISRMQSNREAL